jgi:hypothetical protein
MSDETKDKHTPGPWETGSLMTRVEVLPDGWNAPMCIADCGTKNAPKSETERVANAKLIAASPDLLAALVLCVQDYEATVENYVKEFGAPPPWTTPYYVMSARAAIAKAKGTP